MERDVVLNRILRDMKMSGLISEDSNGYVKIYLNAAYVSGVESGIEIERGKFGKHRERKIVQYNINMIKIAEYDSILKAAKKMKCSDRILNVALKYGTLTRAKHIWKYKEEEVNQTSSSN